MTRIIVLVIVLFSGQSCFGQFRFHKIPKSERNTNNADTIPNWFAQRTFISIDTNLLGTTLIEIDGRKYNYVRRYFSTKANSISTEYGYVNSKNQPDGYWMYKINEHWIPVEGKVSRGYKIGEWGYNCAMICRIKYKWNWNRTKTSMRRSKILYD